MSQENNISQWQNLSWTNSNLSLSLNIAEEEKYADTKFVNTLSPFASLKILWTALGNNRKNQSTHGTRRFWVVNTGAIVKTIKLGAILIGEMAGSWSKSA